MTWLRPVVVALVGHRHVHGGQRRRRRARCRRGRCARRCAWRSASRRSTRSGRGCSGSSARSQLRRASTPARLLAARRLLDDPQGRVAGGRRARAGRVRGRGARGPAGDHRGRHVAGPAGRDPHGRPGHRCDGDAGGRVPARRRVRGHRAGRRRARPASRDRPAEPGRHARRAARLRPSARPCWCRCCSSRSGRRCTALVMFFPLLGRGGPCSPRRARCCSSRSWPAGCALVFAATETSRPLLRSVLADTVVRAD